MGKTNSPLTLYVDAELYATPEMQKLVEMGHNIILLNPVLAECDGIVGSKAWYMPSSHVKYLDVALKEIRRRKREQAPKKDTAGPKAARPRKARTAK